MRRLRRAALPSAPGGTGGQNAATTPVPARSSTMPFGNFEKPFNLPHLAASCGAAYVARWTCLHIRRLTRTFVEAIHHPVTCSSLSRC